MTGYDGRFFDRIRNGCQGSASAAVPVIAEELKPRRVLDVGCGEGWWGKGFEDAGCEVLGIDGEWAKPVIPHISCDLAKESLPDLVGFDLVVCLEVAEHLPAERAATFIEELCRLAPLIVFSAAVPGQGGDGHLNEQWPAYWLELFRGAGYQGTGALRWRLWEDERISWWYRQNLFLFGPIPEGLSVDEASVVHPAMWAHHGHA